MLISILIVLKSRLTFLISYFDTTAPHLLLPIASDPFVGDRAPMILQEIAFVSMSAEVSHC